MSGRMMAHCHNRIQTMPIRFLFYGNAGKYRIPKILRWCCGNRWDFHATAFGRCLHAERARQILTTFWECIGNAVMSTSKEFTTVLTVAVS